VPKLFLPAWYLPNGTIKATESGLEKGSSSSERWSIWCGALVVVAVIAELVIAWIEPPYITFLTDSAIADAAIAIGIVGEVAFGMWDSRIQTELRGRSNKRVAEATVRAAEAELITEKLRSEISWRRLSATEIATTAKFLADFPKHSLRIDFVGADPECNSFAHDIGTIFSQCGWTVGFVAASYFGEVAFGIHAQLYDGPDIEACRIARGALSNAGLSLTGHLPPDLSTAAGSGKNVNSPCAYIYVGPKPMPVLE
jgi:hypothetical protein